MIRYYWIEASREGHRYGIPAGIRGCVAYSTDGLGELREWAMTHDLPASKARAFGAWEWPALALWGRALRHCRAGVDARTALKDCWSLYHRRYAHTRRIKG